MLVTSFFGRTTCASYSHSAKLGRHAFRHGQHVVVFVPVEREIVLTVENAMTICSSPRPRSESRRPPGFQLAVQTPVPVALRLPWRSEVELAKGLPVTVGCRPGAVTAMEERIYYWIAGAVFLFSILVRQKLTSTYRKWSQVRNQAGITGGQTAQLILDANQMRRVKVGPIPGKLTDHYNPRTKEIRLSEPVYATPSVAAMAIAAHESGHAIQDEVDYTPLELRSRLAPLAAAGARFGLPAAIFGSFLGMPALIQVGVLSYAGALLLQFLTLPVEFNASKRALQQLEKLGLLSEQEREAARSVLRSAALTYVAGVASAVGYIIYLAVVGGRWLFRKPPVGAPPFKQPPAV